MSLSLADYNPILKELYDGQKVKDLVYPTQPFYAMLAKKENFEGKLYPLPLLIENNQSIGANFTAAKAVAGSSDYDSFNLTRNKKYGFANIDGETARASRSDKGAFVAALKIEIDSTKKAVVDSIAADLFGNGTGALGVVSTYTTSSNVLVLATADDIVDFHVGMRIVIFNSTNATARAGGATVGGVTNTFEITARDAIAGSFTLNADPTSIVSTDLIFRAGDRGAVCQGLEAWIPSTAPASNDSFFGVNRSVDRSRLAGIYVAAAASDSKIETTLIDGVSLLNREGGRPDMIWISFKKYAELTVELGSKVNYYRQAVDDAKDAAFGFRGLMLDTAFGPIKVMADQHCPDTHAFVLDMKSWALYSVGPAPMIDELDGNMLLRDPASDAVEARIVAYYQLGCNAPGHNGKLTLP